MKARRKLAASIVMIGFSIHAPCFCWDLASVELLTGNQSQTLRFGAQTPLAIMSTATEFNPPFRFSLEYSIGYWKLNRPDSVSSQTTSLTDFGITPLVHWYPTGPIGWYGEAGIGANWFSRRYNNNGREFSTKLQFTSRIGIGYAFLNRWTMGLHVAHVSNGGIRQPNPGVNLIGGQIGRQF